MRKQLRQVGSDERHTYKGTFVREGIKNGYKGIERTILLADVTDQEGTIVTDHLWFNYTKGFRDANLEPGDIVEFTARVSKYVKGYKGYRWDVYKPIEVDYKLSYPTKIKNLSKVNGQLIDS